MKYRNRTVWEFRTAGFKTIHLFRDYYLVRKYSVNYRKISPYNLCKLHTGELIYSDDGRVIGSK